jgi:hypothetical protein
MAIGYQAGTETRGRPGGMAAATAGEPGQRARFAGAGLIVCGIASVVLLAGHPGAGASPALADVLRSEAAQAGADAVVHGGFVLVLTLELVGFAALAVRAGPRRTSVLAAMLFALVGSGLLTASMVVDGLITPGVAARYAAAPAARQEPARALLVLIGTAISVLMPMGLAFLGAAALAWGAALTPMRGAARIGGWVALALGALTLAAAGASLQAAGMIGLMVALLTSAAWAIAAGILLMRWPLEAAQGREAGLRPRAPVSSPSALPS